MNSPTIVSAVLTKNNTELLRWFEDYDSADSYFRKQELASKICRGMQVHISLEREVYDPAFLEQVNDLVGRDAAADQAILSQLTEQVLDSSPIDELFDSKVRILGDAFAERVAVEARYFE